MIGLAASSGAQVPGDVDGDTRPDATDNCPFTPNLNQSDVSGDGIGDLCQCGDASSDGYVDLLDVVLLRRSDAALGPGVDSDLCSVAGDPAVCDGDDVASLRAHLADPAVDLLPLCVAALSTAPLALEAFPGDGVVALRWAALPGASIQGYRLYRGPSGGPYALVDPNAIGVPSYEDADGLANGTAYAYVVSSISAGGHESGFSPEVEVTPTSTGPTNVAAGTISSDTTWTLAGSPYLVAGTVTFAGGANLTVEPGVEVRFAGAAELRIGQLSGSAAGLQGMGTDASPLLFTAQGSTWRGLIVGSALDGSRLEHARIEKVGGVTFAVELQDGLLFDTVEIGERGAIGVRIRIGALGVVLRRLSVEPAAHVALSIAGGDPVVEQAELFADATHYAVDVVGATTATITGSEIHHGMHVQVHSPGMTVSGNTFADYELGQPLRVPASSLRIAGENAIAFADQQLDLRDAVVQVRFVNLSNAIGASTTLSPHTYVFETTVSVGSAASPELVIEAGATLAFVAGTELNVGTLQPALFRALGTAQAPVVFRASTPGAAAGHYRGLTLGQFLDDASLLEHVEIAQAGQGGLPGDASLTILSAAPTVRNATIHTGASNGVLINAQNERPRILNSSVEGHSLFGLRIMGSRSEITGNKIAGSSGGILVTAAFPQLIVRGNDLSGNPVALDNDDLGDGVDARLNWFGSDQNPGALVEGTVRFNPWLGAAPDGAIDVFAGGVHPEQFSRVVSAATTTVNATFSEPIDWTLEFQDGTGTIHSRTGAGASVAETWSGAEASADGVHAFRLSGQAVGGGATAPTIVGEVVLDSQAVVARIASPAEREVLVGEPVPVEGTVAGTGFSGYVLQYRVTGSSGTFGQIGAGSVEVSAGTLGTLPAATLTAGEYEIRLVATASGQTAVDLLTVRVLAVNSPASAPDYLSPNADGKSDSVAVPGSITLDAAWTVEILDDADQTVRTYAGFGVDPSVTWDGRSDLGVVAADGAYSFRITATEAHSGVSDHATFGQLILDTQPPAAAITSPAAGAPHLSYDGIPVVGTATDENFASYRLSYAAPSNPSLYVIAHSPAQIATPVEADVLASVPPGDPEVLPLGNGSLALRLEVSDLAENETVVDQSVLLDRLEVRNVQVTPTNIDPLSSELAQISWELSHDANDVVVELYSGGTRAPDPAFVQVASGARDQGPQQDAWDGKNALGDPAPQTNYYVSIQASDGLGRSVVFNDPADPSVNAASAPGSANMVVNGQGSGGLAFSAYRNDPFEIEFFFGAPGYRCRLLVLTNEHGNPAAEELIAEISPLRGLGPGTHVFHWDGRRDDNGLPYEGTFRIDWTHQEPCPDLEIPSVFVAWAGYRVQELSVEPYVLVPVHGQVAHLEFTLPVESSVEIDLFDPDNVLVRTLLPATVLPAGSHALEWDGRTGGPTDAIVAAEGPYSFEVRATETQPPGRTDVQRASTQVHR